ncbi:uncharacterized protein LOC128205997 [Mya arenaria]|uniref:uncharacterized protein LOC128205997 n=1 Tax=Mya arenaria TaxID=6604 RepID=UPI0022E84D0F|nr:uncharacterized protein LOC128205997 [Mya arenaria]
MRFFSVLLITTLDVHSVEYAKDWFRTNDRLWGEIVNKLCVTLHRFPTDDKLRKLWIKRLKAVSPNFVSSLKNDRLCSVHFANGKYTKKNPFPCVFIINNKEKIFKLSKVESSEPAYKCNDEDQEAENEEYDGPDCTLTTSSVSEYASIKFHDYAGQIEFTVQKTLNKDTQADKVGVSFSTQTEGTSSVSVTKCSVSTQTDFETPLCKCMSKTTSEVGVQVNKPDLTVEDIKSNEMCMFYTGLPIVETFHLLFDERDDVESHTNRCENGENKGRPRALRLIDDFFLVLMRLRFGLLLEDLARRFHVSKSTYSNITNQWISYMSVKLSTLVAWPSRKTLKVTMPQKFKRKYPNCRIIIDCTEFYTETPQSLANKSMMYSHYKSHMTWKALLGISPSGIITFVSDIWSGTLAINS